MTLSLLLRRIITFGLILYFASRIIISYVILQEKHIGTFFNRIVSDTVQDSGPSLKRKAISVVISRERYFVLKTLAALISKKDAFSTRP